MTQNATRFAIDRLSISQLKKMQEKLDQIVRSNQPDEHTVWTMKLRGIVNTFGAVEVYALCEGEGMGDVVNKNTWLDEASRELPDPTPTRSESLMRPVIRGEIAIISQGKRSKDILFQKLWKSDDIVRYSHLSHRTLKTWFDEQTTTAVEPQPTTPIITFYSYKGGMGRTTALAFVAKMMADLGKKVVIVDCDLEAPGVHTLLSDVQPDRGLVDYFYYSRYNPNMNLSDYIIEADAELDPVGNLRILPAGNIADPHYLEKLSYVDIEKMETEEGEDGKSAFQRLFEKICTYDPMFQPDYIFVDSRTGLTSIGGAMLFRYPKKVIMMLGVSEQQKYGLKQIGDNVKRAMQHVEYHWVFTMMPQDKDIQPEQAEQLESWLLEEIYTGQADVHEGLRNRLLETGIKRHSKFESLTRADLRNEVLLEIYRPLTHEVFGG